MSEVASGRRALLIFAALAMIPLPQLGASQTAIRRVPAPYTSPLSGSEMYREYCASCHGVSAKGKGPAAAALKTAPTDLTQLAAKNGGMFPVAKFQSAVEHGPAPAHGSAEMPVWGGIFRDMRDGAALLRLRVLSEYVEQLQAK